MPYSEKAVKALNKLKSNASEFEPSLKTFFKEYAGLCMYTLVIWILFWSLGFPNVIRYGFPLTADIMEINKMPRNENGGIMGGIYGSGTFPCSLLLFLLSTILLIKEMICYFFYPSVKELEERIENITISKRLGSMRQMSSLQKEDMVSVGVDAASLNPLT